MFPYMIDLDSRAVSKVLMQVTMAAITIPESGERCPRVM
jgi:hypothetical protein